MWFSRDIIWEVSGDAVLDTRGHSMCEEVLVTPILAFLGSVSNLVEGWSHLSISAMPVLRHQWTSREEGEGPQFLTIYHDLAPLSLSHTQVSDGQQWNAVLLQIVPQFKSGGAGGQEVPGDHLCWSSSLAGFTFSNLKPLTQSVAPRPICGESVMGPLSLTEEGSGTQREELPSKAKVRSKEYILEFKSRKNNHQFQIYPYGNSRRGMSSSPFADEKTSSERWRSFAQGHRGWQRPT